MSFIMLVPFLGLLVIIVIWDKLESIPSVRKGKPFTMVSTAHTRQPVPGKYNC